MKTQTVNIQGMHCQACEKVVTKRLGSLPGVTNVHVDLENGTATVQTDQDLTQESAASALQDTHYTVTDIQTS